jgi:hypothetical protein
MDAAFPGLAKRLAKRLEAGGVPYPITIVRHVITGGPAWDPTFEDEPHPCRGWVDAWTDAETFGTLIESGDAKIIVIVQSLDIQPTTADSITARGQTFAIVSVMPDPALATYTVQARHDNGPNAGNYIRGAGARGLLSFRA